MVVAEFKISIDDKGAVSVTGPIDQLMLCYGLLEVAKDSLRNHAIEKAKTIQKPGFGEVAAFGRKE